MNERRRPVDPFFMDRVARPRAEPPRHEQDPFNIADVQDENPEASARSGRCTLVVPTNTARNGYPDKWQMLCRASGASIPRVLHVSTQGRTSSGGNPVSEQNGYAGVGFMCGSIGVPITQLEPWMGFTFHGDSAALKLEYGLGSARRTVYADLSPGSYALPPSDNIIISASRWNYDQSLPGAAAAFDVEVTASIADELTADRTPLTISGVCNMIAPNGVGGWRAPVGAFAWDLDILSTGDPSDPAPTTVVPGTATAPIVYTSGLQTVLVDASTPQKWPPTTPYVLHPQVASAHLALDNLLLVNCGPLNPDPVNVRLIWFLR